jgi:hypothetical protein
MLCNKIFDFLIINNNRLMLGGIWHVLVENNSVGSLSNNYTYNDTMEVDYVWQEVKIKNN